MEIVRDTYTFTPWKSGHVCVQTTRLPKSSSVNLCRHFYLMQKYHHKKYFTDLLTHISFSDYALITLFNLQVRYTEIFISIDVRTDDAVVNL